MLTRRTPDQPANKKKRTQGRVEYTCGGGEGVRRSNCLSHPPLYSAIFLHECRLRQELEKLRLHDKWHCVIMNSVKIISRIVLYYGPYILPIIIRKGL